MTLELGVDPECLQEPDEAALTWRVIKPAFWVVRLDDAAALAANLVRLSAGQRALLALHWCVSGVCNGGFDQFFTNPSGRLAQEALTGCERIGVAESAGVLRRALNSTLAIHAA